MITIFFSRKSACFLLLFSIISGAVAGRLNSTGALVILFATALFFLTKISKNKYLRPILIFASLLVAVMFLLHLVPGVNNWLVASNLAISKNSYIYNLYFNFDSPTITLILAVLLCPDIDKKSNYRKIITQSIMPVVLAIIVISSLSILFGLVRFDPKIMPLFIIWAVNNMFFTCCTEEIVFRGWLQNVLSSICSNLKYSGYIALALASIAFGLYHYYRGGNVYMCLSMIAGIFYGYAYLRTKKVQSSIIVHFSLNTAHFLGFTYPALII